MEISEYQGTGTNHPTRRHTLQAWERNEQLPAFPLARITTCGPLTIEVLKMTQTGNDGHVEAIYGPPDAALLARKGTSTAFLLLALLASQPGLFAPKDWLSEKLGHVRALEDEEEDEDASEGEGLKRVDNVVSRLRFLLFPLQAHEGPDEQKLRRRLVEYRRASGESGPGYQLAGTPWLWLDVVEIDAAVKRARRLEQFGEDGLAEWQTAYELAMGGRFLPGEVYSDWAQWRQQQVDTHLWECVQVLWRRAAAQGEVGEVEALRILREYWQAHVTNEDALRPLLELLGKRECFGEAHAYYEQLCAALTDEGKQPDQRTTDIIEFLQAVQLQRKYIARDPRTIHLASPIWANQFHSVSPITVHDILEERDDALQGKMVKRRDALPLLGQMSNNELLKGIIARNFSQEMTYDLLSSNVRTMNFRDEWQYIVNNLVSEIKSGLRAMVFDVELTRWWNTIAGQVYMMTNMELLKRGVSLKRIFILSSFDTRLQMNALVTAYVHRQLGVDVKVCNVAGFQNSIPFKPDMFSVHDNLFVALYYFSLEKPITNLLLEDKYIAEFRSFYDELFVDDRLCTDIDAIIARSEYRDSFFTSAQMQLEFVQRLRKVESITDLARKPWLG